MSGENESNVIGAGVIFSPFEEERMKLREQLINRLPLNVNLYIPASSPLASSPTTLSSIGTNKRDTGVSSSVVNAHSLSDIHRDVD